MKEYGYRVVTIEIDDIAFQELEEQCEEKSKGNVAVYDLIQGNLSTLFKSSVFVIDSKLEEKPVPKEKRYSQAI